LQASDEYFTFENERITVLTSAGSSLVLKNIFVARGTRQTLLIPSDFSQEWVQVSYKHTILKIKTHGRTCKS